MSLDMRMVLILLVLCGLVGFFLGAKTATATYRGALATNERACNTVYHQIVE